MRMTWGQADKECNRSDHGTMSLSDLNESSNRNDIRKDSTERYYGDKDLTTALTSQGYGVASL